MSGDSTEFDIAAEVQSEEDSYRALSPWAVLALVLGLASALTLVHPLLALLPVLALASGFAALRQIRHYAPTYIGRWAALVGMWLAILFLVAMPTRWLVWRTLIEGEATRFGNEFMRLLVQEQAIEAHQLSLPLAIRMPTDETMLEIYREDPARVAGVKSFVADPPIRTLLALGERADVRLYDVESIVTNGDSAVVALLYAITFDDAGVKRTFFVRLILLREAASGDARSSWKVHHVAGDVLPNAEPAPDAALNSR